MAPKKKKVLLIDDDVDLLDLLEEFLVQYGGYDITRAEDSITALKLISTYSYDFVLLDLFLPGLSGLEVLKNFADKKESTFIVMTGTHHLEKDALQCGASAFLKKPIEFEDFIDILDPQESEEKAS